MKLEGIIVPLITPLRPDESLDEAGLEKLVEHVITGGVSGIFVAGSSGEGPTLSEAVKQHVVCAVSEQAKGRATVLVGIFDGGTRQVAEQARRLASKGGDVIVVTAPYYFTHTQDEIVAHISTVARAQVVPTMIYNIPQTVKTIVEPETVAQLAELPEIIGIKDSYGDMARFQKLLSLQQVHEDFRVFQGAEAVAGISVICGAAGMVLGLANVAPRLCVDLYVAAKAAELECARELQQRLVTLWRLHTRGQWLPCLKAAVAQLGICEPTATLPFDVLGPDAVQAIRRDMEAAGLVLP